MRLGLNDQYEESHAGLPLSAYPMERARQPAGDPAFKQLLDEIAVRYTAKWASAADDRQLRQLHRLTHLAVLTGPVLADQRSST